MAWVTPKTDWVPLDGISDTDLNRIEGNIAYLGDRVVLSGTCQSVISGNHIIVPLPAGYTALNTYVLCLLIGRDNFGGFGTESRWVMGPTGAYEDQDISAGHYWIDCKVISDVTGTTHSLSIGMSNNVSDLTHDNYKILITKI